MNKLALDYVNSQIQFLPIQNGDYKLNKQNYLFAFANFLLAKGIYGPGKYLFGTFDNREIDESYKVVYNDDSDMED